MNKLVSIAALLSSFLLACGGHDIVKDIKPSSPAGTFGGQSWAMSKATVKNDGTNLSVHLFADSTVADCAEFAPQGSTIGVLNWTEPAQLGRRDLQLSFDLTDPTNQTVTFYNPSSNNNDIAVDGVLNVTALDATSVTIGMIANGSTGDAVNGTINATFCP